jgi:hypothetical protein
LEEIEHKADKGKLSMSEIQYADMLTHLKKNLLKTDEMTGEGEFSMGMRNSYNRGYNDMSYTRGRRRDTMGRYSMEGYSRNDEMVDKLRDMMEDAPDDMTRKEFEKFIQKVERM